MPYERPTLSELRVRTAADINASLPGVDALLRYSNLGILADVLAALANGHYGYLDWIALQSVPFTATDEYLEGWAGLKGVTRFPAIASVGNCSFPAQNGTVVPSGATINRVDGVSYTVTAAGTAADGIVLVPVKADIGGANGNTPQGARMILGAGISGVTASGLAQTDLVGGFDVESDAQLRSRMLAVYAAPPQGGALADYPNWARAVPGVTRAWVNPNANGPGTVEVLFMMDEVRADFAGFPQGADGGSAYETRRAAATGDQLLIANALFTKQPVTVLVTATAPVRNVVSLTIAGLAAANATTKAAIATAFAASLLNGSGPGGRVNVQTIEAAIAAVPLTDGFVITAIAASAGTVELGAAGNILSSARALPTAGVITYA